jgi:hypothetical protein
MEFSGVGIFTERFIFVDLWLSFSTELVFLDLGSFIQASLG